MFPRLCAQRHGLRASRPPHPESPHARPRYGVLGHILKQADTRSPSTNTRCVVRELEHAQHPGRAANRPEIPRTGVLHLGLLLQRQADEPSPDTSSINACSQRLDPPREPPSRKDHNVRETEDRQTRANPARGGGFGSPLDFPAKLEMLTNSVSQSASQNRVLWR